MLTIDGSMGEGGGQILRSALALSLCLERPFRIVAIRARRPQPGLRPQHLAAVRAAAKLCDARVDGAALGARELTFIPGKVRAGAYHFDIGTAGSTSLVLHTVLPALVTADRPSELVLEGGTHNPRAPTFDHVSRAYLPQIERLGPRVDAELERAGFEPVGGGRVRVRVQPVARLEPLRVLERGAVKKLEAEILSSRLPRHVAERESAALVAGLGLSSAAIRVRMPQDAAGPGNVVTVFAVCERLTEVFASFGRRRVPAERVARGAVAAVRRYLAADAPVGVFLADQLVLPLALAGAGCYVTLPPSGHTLTNIRVVQAFLPLDVRCSPTEDPRRWRVEVREPRTMATAPSSRNLSRFS